MFAGVGGFNNVIDEAAASSDVGRGERRPIRFDELGATGGFVHGLVHLFAEDDLDSSLGPHYGDFSAGPGEDAVRAEILRPHGDVGAAVGLAENDLDFGNGGRRVSEQQLGAVTDDAAV